MPAKVVALIIGSLHKTTFPNRAIRSRRAGHIPPVVSRAQPCRTGSSAFGAEVLKLWNAVEVCRWSVHFRAIPSAIRANVRCEMWMQTAGERSFLDSVTGASGMEVAGITVACVAATACLYLGLSLGDALR